MFTGPCSAARDERSAGDSGSAMRRARLREGSRPRGVRTIMGSTSALPLTTAVATMAAAGPGLADDRSVTFPATFASAQYAPPALEVTAGDAVTFTGGFDYHPL